MRSNIYVFFCKLNNHVYERNSNLKKREKKTLNRFIPSITFFFFFSIHIILQSFTNVPTSTGFIVCKVNFNEPKQVNWYFLKCLCKIGNKRLSNNQSLKKSFPLNGKFFLPSYISHTKQIPLTS